MEPIQWNLPTKGIIPCPGPHAIHFMNELQLQCISGQDRLEMFFPFSCKFLLVSIASGEHINTERRNK